MRHPFRSFFAVAALALFAAAGLPASGLARPGHPHRHVCAGAAAGQARCHADVVTDANGKPLATSGPVGYGPADLQSAYRLPSATAGSGQTIAIVDAYNDPNAEADLGVYRSQFGLSPCTTANGCFRKVNELGSSSSYPSNSASWSQEISLDLDMASAVCPHCNILLVEASSASLSDLGKAENEAAALGATEISNSYGGSEFSSEASYEGYYNHPGVAITVSSGDTGYPDPEFPAVSRYVTAVGGTHLTKAGNGRGWVESAWSNASSGCSAYIPKPTWQTDPSCANRTTADVSAVADPNTGVAVYDSYAYLGASGWLEFGGTSVSSPIVAGVYALSGNAATVGAGSYPYAHTSALFDAGETYLSRVRSEAGVLHYWRLGETSGSSAHDSVGSAGGTYSGGVTLGQPGALAADSNSAAGFDGTTGYVSLPALESESVFTVEGWTNLNSGSSSSPGGNNAVLARYGDVRLLARPSGVYAGVWVAGTEYRVDVATASNVGAWVHWALVRDGSSLTVYRDGVAVGSTAAPAGTTSLSATIGAQSGSAYFLHGSIDEVAVYGAALSAATVKDHYYLGVNGPSTGSNGSCGGGYLCTATPGYDGPTGLGTPNGVSGF